MLHHLPALLAALAAPPRLAADDVDPLAISDGASVSIWMSGVRMDGSGVRLACKLTQMRIRDDSVHPSIQVGVTAGRGGWVVDGCTVAGRQVAVDPERVLAVLAAARHQIRAGLVPEFARLLLDFTGLRAASTVSGALPDG